MILIGDIGGSKGDWRLIDGEEIHQDHTKGFNPVHNEIESFLDIIPKVNSSILNVYIYGSGVFNVSYSDQLHSLLKSHFHGATIEIASDVLGACRSLFGKDSGVACILGTGSAACMYDGKNIIHRVPSLGYILGDEGSGFVMGKAFLNAYLRESLPSKLSESFEKEFGKLDEQTVLDKTYGKGGKMYVASFAEQVIKYQSDPFVHSMIEEQFHLFFDRFFTDLPSSEPVRFTGSIAYFLSNALKRVARKRNLTVDLVSQYPISGLTLYHQKYG